MSDGHPTMPREGLELALRAILYDGDAVSAAQIVIGEGWRPPSEVADVEASLRYEWWLNHGHGLTELYGDDGEMACGACPADFKRQPIEELRVIVRAARLVRAAEATGGS